MSNEKDTEAEPRLKKQLPPEKHSDLCSSDSGQRRCTPQGPGNKNLLKFLFLSWASANVIFDAYLNHSERLHQLAELLTSLLLLFK